MKTRFPHIRVPLAGEDGNAFMILGRCVKAMRDAGLDAATVAEFRDAATAGNYNVLLTTVMAWFDTSDDEEYEDDEDDEDPEDANGNFKVVAVGAVLQMRQGDERHRVFVADKDKGGVWVRKWDPVRALWRAREVTIASKLSLEASVFDWLRTGGGVRSLMELPPHQSQQAARWLAKAITVGP